MGHLKKFIFAVVAVMAVCSCGQAAEVYVRKRPPSSDKGIVYKDIFYYFTNYRGAKCDLILNRGCYVTSNAKVTRLADGIVQVRGELYCSKIPDTSERLGFKFGYGQCSSSGWIPARDP